MKKQRIFFFIVIVFAAFAVIAYIVQSKIHEPGLKQDMNLVMADEPKQPFKQSHTVVTGKIVELNTNAQKITFIKVRDNDTQTEISYRSILRPEELNLSLGDLIEVPTELPKSNNGHYFLINSTVDFKLLEKNKTARTKVETVIPLQDINEDLQGLEIITSGKVSDYFNSKKGHSFFQISDDKKTIKGVLFAAEASEMTERQNLIQKAESTGEVIKFKGKVAIYKGELEVIVNKVWK